MIVFGEGLQVFKEWSASGRKEFGFPIYQAISGFVRVGKATYRLGLPEELSQIHSTSYVLQLRKFVSGEDIMASLGDLQGDERLNYIERSVAVLERELKVQVATSEGIRVDLGVGGWNAKALSGFFH